MSGVPKLLIVYAVAIPLAIVLGFLISAPGMGSIVVVGLLMFLFSLQFLLKHHHLLLIFVWNSAFNAFFLPSQPHLWLLVAMLSLGISWLNDVMGQKKFIKVPEISRPLLFLAAVVAGTILVRGGLGVRALGASSYGGRGYFYMAGAIIGYFALTAERIPLRKTAQRAGIYFASASTFALPNLVFFLGPSFYFLYLLLPPDFAMTQAQAEFGTVDIDRLSGLPPACSGIIFFLLVRYGIKGILDWQRPWRFFLFLAMLIAAGLGGFRTVYVLVGLTLVVQFFLEGLHRTAYLGVSAGIGIAAIALVFVCSDKLPLSMQRAISFLPVKVDSSVKLDAESSWDWRVQMWNAVVPDIPRYFLIGKGYRLDPGDLYLAQLATEMGLSDSFEASRVAGDFHSGPLSLIISFGIFGVISFVWLIIAGLRALTCNYRYGPASLRSVNTFLLAFFIAHSIFFFAFFGDVRSDIATFAGVLGLSVSLNGGIVKMPLAKAAAVAKAQLVPVAG